MSNEFDDTVVHEADGIQELDNKLPRWWVLLFYFTVIFSLCYLSYFHLMDLGFGQEEKHAYAVKEAAAELAALQASREKPDFTKPSTAVAVLATGKELWESKCATCHFSDARGGIGPNLTDDYWIHGATFADNMHVIAEGVLDKGMEAWKRKMSEPQRYAVASYLYTLRGTQPAAAKPPEGEQIPGSDRPDYNPDTAPQPTAAAETAG